MELQHMQLQIEHGSKDAMALGVRSTVSNDIIGHRVRNPEIQTLVSTVT